MISPSPLALVPAALFAPAALSHAVPPSGGHTHRPSVLGASLDLAVSSSDPLLLAHADHVVEASLAASFHALDTRDSRSSLAAWSRGEVAAPPPAAGALLALYDRWERETGGAVSCRIGALVALWREAAASGVAPSADALAAARESRDGLPDVDALGKAFALEAAADALSRTFPDLPGFLLNLGGDIVCRGVAPDGLPWRVAIASPDDPAANAGAVAFTRLTDGAVVTSGEAHRGAMIGGVRRSHVLDPRTGEPAAGARGATVIAADAVTANALSCAIMVLGSEAADSLLARYAVAARVFCNDGSATRAGRSPELLAAAPQEAAPAWADGKRFRLTVKLPKGRKKRPYLAVWITNKSNEPVRNIVVWGTKPKYQKSLKNWWEGVVNKDAARAAAVSKSTNKGGEYVIEWDGRDDGGKPVAPDDYTLHVEVSEEDAGSGMTTMVVPCRSSAFPSRTIPLGGCKKSLDALSVSYARP